MQGKSIYQWHGVLHGVFHTTSLTLFTVAITAAFLLGTQHKHCQLGFMCERETERKRQDGNPLQSVCSGFLFISCDSNCALCQQLGALFSLSHSVWLSCSLFLTCFLHDLSFSFSLAFYTISFSFSFASYTTSLSLLTLFFSLTVSIVRVL